MGRRNQAPAATNAREDLDVLVLAYAFSNTTLFAGWHWPAVVFTTVVCIFFVPSVLLGTFQPAVTKVAVQRTIVVGRTIGSVSAWSAAGSILGTIASGFWLISAIGTRRYYLNRGFERGELYLVKRL